jgi:glyoxylase-like metal-dependent hydrolase (beta-lactamase superfamily II)
MHALNQPTLFPARAITDDWTLLPSYLPIPQMGVLAVNSALLRGAEPLLVDTGLAALREDFMASLRRQIDLEDLRWIWLSHTDPDHLGNLESVLAEAPNAQLLTNFLGMGKLNLAGYDVGRVRLLDGESPVEVGGRRLHPVRPPYYDAPESIGFFDPKDSLFFAVDSFGALLGEPVSEVAEIPPQALRDGLLGWSSIDAPWLTKVDAAGFGRTLAALEELNPERLLSSHLPIAPDGVSRLTGILAEGYCGDLTKATDPLSVEHLLLGEPAEVHPGGRAESVVT